jgi:hypothetical protein
MEFSNGFQEEQAQVQRGGRGVYGDVEEAAMMTTMMTPH